MQPEPWESCKELMSLRIHKADPLHPYKLQPSHALRLEPFPFVNTRM